MNGMWLALGGRDRISDVVNETHKSELHICYVAKRSQ
jgi:hypothetical protein